MDQLRLDASRIVCFFFYHLVLKEEGDEKVCLKKRVTKRCPQLKVASTPSTEEYF